MTTKTLPRGYRNRNPGNVDRTNERWIGMDPDQTGDPRFIVFVDHEHGIRCVMRLLVTYDEKHNLNTIRGIIGRWAPSNGVNPATGKPYTQNTEGYINHVAAMTKLHPDEPLDMLDRDTNLAITKAIIRHELGDPKRFGIAHPFWYDDATYDKALALAGFAPDTKPLTQSRTIGGSVIAGGAAVAGAVYESLGDSVTAATAATEKMTFLSGDVVGYIFTAIVLMGTGAAIYARVTDQSKRLT
jgi:hypothetical protein